MRRFWLTLAGLLVACGQVQFPDGNFQPARQKDPGAGAYELVFADVMEFREGRLGEFTIVGKVPAPGRAVLAVEGLPPGAVFLPDPARLSWVPPLGSALDPAEPTAGYRVYQVRFTLASDLAPAVLRRTAGLIVRKANLTGGER
jgi:hypothetical protein